MVLRLPGVLRAERRLVRANGGFARLWAFAPWAAGTVRRTPMRITRASHADIEPLVALARRSFFDTYQDIDDHDAIREHCARHFTPARFASLLADETSCVLVATDDSGELAGYALVAVSEPPACVVGPAPVELARLYLAKQWIGRGVGAALMREVIREALRRGGQTLWLGVYEHNKRAMAFYERFGMKVVGTKLFEFGGEFFDDPVMAGPIGA